MNRILSLRGLTTGRTIWSGTAMNNKKRRTYSQYSETEVPPPLLAGEESVNGFLWWSHFGSEGFTSSRVLDLLAGAVLYADGHAPPTSNIILGHIKVVPDMSYELGYPVAVIQRSPVTAPRGATGISGSATDSTKASQSHPSATQDTLPSTEGLETQFPKEIPTSSFTTSKDKGPTTCTGEPSTVGECATVTPRPRSARKGFIRVQAFHCELEHISNIHRLSLVRCIMLMKDGPERLLTQHFTAAMSVLLAAGPVAIAADVLEAPAILKAVLGTPNAQSLMVSTEVFIALLIALAAGRSASPSLVNEVVRTTYLCGVVVPPLIVRQLGVYMATVGHANAASIMLRSLAIEGVEGHDMCSLAARLQAELPASQPQIHDPTECLCEALQAPLKRDAVTETIQLFDKFVPILVSPSKARLIHTVATNAANEATKGCLLDILRSRCTPLERSAFDNHLKSVPSREAAAEPIRRSGSKLQRALK